MKFNKKNLKAAILSAAIIAACGAPVQAQEKSEQAVSVERVVQINPTTVELRLSDKQRVTLDFYGENIFRMFRDANGYTAVYPTFINEGNQGTIGGDDELVKVTLKANKNVKFNIKAVDGVIVDKHLNTIKF